MSKEQARLVEMAARRIHPDYTPILERLVECDGGDRYLREKVVNAPDIDSLTANSRVLKYANYLVEAGAHVAFVREGHGKTPDLSARVNGTAFFLEVRRFRTTDGSVAKHPVDKIIDAVTTKRSQLPPFEIGFVAIDNFDLGLESHHEGGFTHDHLVDGLCELERLARSNPAGWQRPSGVIIAPHTSGGAFSGGQSPFPHFVWMNGQGTPPVPSELLTWLASSLPGGSIFNADMLPSRRRDSLR